MRAFELQATKLFSLRPFLPAAPCFRSCKRRLRPMHPGRPCTRAANLERNLPAALPKSTKKESSGLCKARRKRGWHTVLCGGGGSATNTAACLQHTVPSPADDVNTFARGVCPARRDEPRQRMGKTRVRRCNFALPSMSGLWAVGPAPSAGETSKARTSASTSAHEPRRRDTASPSPSRPISRAPFPGISSTGAASPKRSLNSSSPVQARLSRGACGGW